MQALIDAGSRAGTTTSERGRRQDNRRVILVRLTSDGRALAGSMFQPLGPVLAEAAGDPDAPYPARLAHCLHRIADLMAAEAINARS